MPPFEILRNYWPHLASLLSLAVTIPTVFHILLKKRDTKAATGWVGLVWFAPFLGACLYWLFGVNRIERRAKARFARKEAWPLPTTGATVSPEYIAHHFPAEGEGLANLCRLTEKVARQPLLSGNTIVPLINGDQAFPLMLAHLEKAKKSITLTSYIFNNDSWGKRFRVALSEAQKRGVEIRVIIDGVGARYSFPPITWALQKEGIKTASFMRTLLPWRYRYVNLRSHRKIMVVDGTIGFTGGLNICAENVLAENPAHPIQDIHFLITGPVVGGLQCAFAEDWAFTTGEKLQGEKWFPPLSPDGDGIARGIIDGPDEDFDMLRLVILGALTAAHSSIWIATPYFLPDNELLTALRLAALRGIDVQILIPKKSNLLLVDWAAEPNLEELLTAGCRIFHTPPPFDHSKIMIVDQAWVLLGSANWDTRSLALNFEFNLECYDKKLAAEMQEILTVKKAQAQEITVQQLRAKSLPIRLRNNFCRLFSPYL